MLRLCVNYLQLGWGGEFTQRRATDFVFIGTRKYRTDTDFSESICFCCLPDGVILIRVCYKISPHIFIHQYA